MLFENPIQFELNKNLENDEVQYSNIIEIAQGGPEIGLLSVNGKILEGYLFGGPCIFNNDYIFAPLYIKSFFSSGFKLAQIEIKSRQVTKLGKCKDLIYLDKVKNNKVYFFEDLDKTILSYHEL